MIVNPDILGKHRSSFDLAGKLMWLIDRHSDGRDTTRIPLPELLRDALVRWYAGEGTVRDEQAGITLVQQARIGAKWIACDCLAGGEPPPILTPAFISEHETFYLRRLTGSKRPEHRGDCPFFRDQATNRITEVRNPQTPSDSPAGYFEVLRPAPEKLAQKPDEDSTDDRTRNASVPRLARLLWRLQHASGLTVIPPVAHERDERTIAAEFHAISKAATLIEVAPGIELGRALWTHASALHSKRLYAGLRELAKRWPAGHAPQAFLTLFAQGYKGSTIYVPGCEPVVIANRVQSPSVRGNIVKGPYLVIVVAGEYPQAHGYAPLRAYAQPIYSGTRFVPVDSEFERSALRSILAARSRFHRAGIDLAIEKPVFDQSTPIGPCRPDFLIEARSRSTGEIRRLVIEATGFAIADYLIFKSVTHPRMRLIAPVVEITPQEVETDRVFDILSAALDI